jgi:hypothetical protein
MESPGVFDKMLVQRRTPTYRFGAEVQVFANEKGAPTHGAEMMDP